MIRTIVLRGSIGASAPQTKLDSIPVPAGKKWTILEVRPYTDAGGSLDIYLYVNTTQIYHVPAETINLFKLPIPGNLTVGESNTIYLMAKNDNASAQNVVVELVIDEQ